MIKDQARQSFPSPAIKWISLTLRNFFSSFSFFQLETIIGKLKTEKYGSRILEEIVKYTETEQPENDAPDNSALGDGQGSEKKPTKRLEKTDVAQGNGKKPTQRLETDEAQGSEKKPRKRSKTDEGQGSENGATKRLKSKKAVVLIESSGDET